MTFTPKTYRGNCALCGAPVRFTTEFASFAYYTCNMDDEVRETKRLPHAGFELRRYWEHGRAA